VEKLMQAVLAKAFRGELVPTEAELARAEGRDYEPASALLERIRAERGATIAATPGRAPLPAQLAAVAHFAPDEERSRCGQPPGSNRRGLDSARRPADNRLDCHRRNDQPCKCRQQSAGGNRPKRSASAPDNKGVPRSLPSGQRTTASALLPSTNMDRHVANTLFNDGAWREVYETPEGRQYVDVNGEPVYGLWFIPPDELEPDVIVGRPTGRR
jgi:hypothetical protein